MNKKFNYLIILLLIVSSCKKEESNIGSSQVTFSPTVMTNLKGIILDENQDPISGVTVRLGNSNLTSSSANGLFTFNNISVAANRAMIYFEKDGYFTTSRACEVNNDVSNYLRVVMDEQQIIGNFPSSSGGSLSYNDINFTFPSNSYFYEDGTEFYGDVNVAANKISPDDVNFSMRIPGGDLLASTTNGEDMRLYSYGMLDVVLTDNNGLIGGSLSGDDNTNYHYKWRYI